MADMNEIIRNAGRPQATRPTPASVVRDLRRVAASLDPQTLAAFRQQIAEALDAVDAAQSAGGSA